MTVIKLDRIDRFIQKIGDIISKIGFKRIGGKLYNFILNRHGVPKNQNMVWLNKTHIEY